MAAESTVHLLAELRGGNERAREALIARYLPVLRRWAHGRLPKHARSVADTEDLVQLTLIRAMDKLDAFEPTREGAFLAYLRQCVMNAVRDEIRRASNRHEQSAGDDEPAAQAPTALDEVIGRDTLRQFETALAELPEVQQEAIMMRVEFGFTHQEVADAIGASSAGAARMMVQRALVGIADKMALHA